MRTRSVLSSIRWRGVLIGLTAGLLVMAVIAFLGSLVVRSLNGGDAGMLAVVALANFVAQLLAGLVGGRFAGQAAVFNGSFAGLAFFATSTALQVLDGARPGVFTILLFGAVSAALGAAGGALVRR